MWQPVLMISGYFISVIGLAMLFPAFIDIYENDANWSYFITTAIINLFIGMSLFLANQTKIRNISMQQAYLLTTISWVSVIFLSTMPFTLSGLFPNFADAFFETTSGITTTGATVMSSIQTAPKSILLWRAILSGLGGIGIVIFATALLPFLGIGGMAIFQRENSDINEKLLPKISYIAKSIIIVYITILGSCAFCYRFAGMNWFDAICHALTTVSTCGFANLDNSFAGFNSVSIEMIAVVFMILGSLPLTYYHSVFVNKDKQSLRAEQVVFFLKTISFYILGTAIWLTYTGVYNFADALRYSAFNVTSITTSTGFVSADYVLWGNFASSLFLVFALTGGCAGSTSGSIKVFRWQVVISFLKKTLQTITEPHRVLATKIGQVNSDNHVVASVLAFLAMYFFSIVILALLIALDGLDFDTSFSAVIACITNSGPGIGKVIGPSGNYSSLSDYVKYVLSFAMLLGRLEILTIIVIFTKSFWKR